MERVDEETGKSYVAIPESEIRASNITKLKAKLEEKAETSKRIGEAAGSEDLDFKGQVLLQCDKRLPFIVIRSVMFTTEPAVSGTSVPTIRTSSPSQLRSL